MPRRLLIAFATLTLGVAEPALANGGHNGARSQDPSFSGSCHFTATIGFQPPLTNTPQNVTDTARGSGACSGSFTGQDGSVRQLADTPVSFFASDQGNDVSCAAGESTGSGTLLFPGGKIAFALEETRATGGSLLSLSGANGGSAQAVASISQSENPIALAQECLGSGIREADVDIQLKTTPAIAG